MFTEEEESEVPVGDKPAEKWTDTLLQRTAAICLFDPPAGTEAIGHLKERAASKLNVDGEDPIFHDKSIKPPLWERFWDRIAASNQRQVVTSIILRIYKPPTMDTKDQAVRGAGGAHPQTKEEFRDEERGLEKESGTLPADNANDQEKAGDAGAVQPDPAPALEGLVDKILLGSRDFDLPEQFLSPQDPELKTMMAELLPKAIMKQRVFSAINRHDHLGLESLLHVNRQLDLGKTKNRQGESPLKRAILNGSIEVVRCLLSKRRVDVSGEQGLDAIKTVVENPDPGSPDERYQRDMIDLLLKSGAGVRTGTNLAKWAKGQGLEPPRTTAEAWQLLESPSPLTGPSAAILIQTTPDVRQLEAIRTTKLSVRQFIAAAADKPHSFDMTQLPLNILYNRHDSTTEGNLQPDWASTRGRAALDEDLGNSNPKLKSGNSAMCRWYHIPSNNVSYFLASCSPGDVLTINVILMPNITADDMGPCE
ncbi:hypothetical protein OQA88_12869 [Cercophora sp. LCS_1]